MINIEKTRQELGIDPDTCPVTARIYRTCDYCNQVDLVTKNDLIRGRHTVAKDACSNKECMKKKRQESQLMKFGVENYVESEEFKQKAAQTNLKKYGKENYAQTKEHKEKAKKTCLEKYGQEHYLATEKSKQERKEICLDKYGVDHYSKTEERTNRIKQKCLEQYGVEYYLQSPICKKKFKQTCLERYGVDHYSKTPAGKKQIQQTIIDRYGVSCGFLHNRNYGKTQLEICDFLNSFGHDFKSNYTVLEGKEIDLYDHTTKIGIEYCGLYWHNEFSPSRKDKNYHFKKYKECQNQGITLITVFEDEWMQKKQICKNILQSLLGHFSTRLYARNCETKLIDKSLSKQFLNDNHLLGASKFSKISVGLLSNNKLFGLLSLGNHHRKKDKNLIVLDRLCFSPLTQIIGGASRMLSVAKKWAKENGYYKIITWSDNRWSSGKVYEKMGFLLDEEIGPDYSYVDLQSHSRKSKQSQKKKNTNCPSHMTERDWSILNGLVRIWDCGKKRWTIQVNGG